MTVELIVCIVLIIGLTCSLVFFIKKAKDVKTLNIKTIKENEKLEDERKQLLSEVSDLKVEKSSLYTEIDTTR